MGNIIDYVHEYGKHTFSEEPLNEVDSLVLCQMVYLNFGQFVKGPEERNAPVSIRSIYRHPERDKILDDYWYRENNMALFTAMAESVRFGSLKMNYYVNIINEDEETQFSAMTYILDDKNAYIAYRGTDATIVGWKEDFNLAFSKPLHSQYLSVEYMNRVAGCIAGGFYAGGHSKGGNLAVYAAMNCAPETKEKLIKVFNNDGPGFRPEIEEQGGLKEIEDKIVKFIPRSSLVGMILEAHGNYEIIDSKSIGMLQHNAYNWKIDKTSFVRVKSMGSGKVFLDSALNEWILSLTEEETHAFIDTLYDIVAASEARDLFQLGADLKKSMQNMRDAARDLDEDTKKAVQKIFRSLFELTREKAFSEVKVFQQEIQEKTRELQQEIQRKKPPKRLKKSKE